MVRWPTTLGVMNLAKDRGHSLTFGLAVFSVILVVAMVLYPDVAFNSAVRGLKIWWEIVFPALLPFFIGSQVLMGLGVVHFMGVLLEPLMRPVFNVPGAGSFVMAMGLASGYPIGSVLTAELRRQQMVSKTEAERLMSFTNTADPLFMAGAVAVGMFGRPAVAGVIMAAHYISSLVTGLALRFYKYHSDRSPAKDGGPGNIMSRAFRALVAAREKDGRPFGQMLGDSVRRSIDTLLLIGGFIILFSVIIQMLTRAGIVNMVTAPLNALLPHLGLDVTLGGSFISGFFEITLGTQLAGKSPAPLDHRLVAAGAIIAWSGLSVHAQVAAMIQGTDINIVPYLLSRLFHAVAAGAVTALLLVSPWGQEMVQTVTAATQGPAKAAVILSWWNRLELASLVFLALLLGFLLAGLALVITRKVGAMLSRTR